MTASSNFARAMVGSRKRTPVDRREYQRLLGKSLPHVIKTETENEHYVRQVEELDAHVDELTSAEKELAELLTVLIEHFEDRHYALKPASPLEVLEELMRANALKQKDLVDVFGTASIVSEVMKGKRRLTIDHIRRLSQRFHVSPELFL